MLNQIEVESISDGKGMEEATEDSTASCKTKSVDVESVFEPGRLKVYNNIVRK